MVSRDSGFGARGSERTTRGWGLETLIGLGILMVTTSAAAQERSKQLPAAEGKLTIRIYEYAGIPHRTLQAASGEAATILGKAGMETEWQLCAAAEGQMLNACNVPMRRDELMVRIVRRAKPRKGALGCTECGVAIEDAQGLGVYSTLYADCLDTMPSIDGLLPSAMLGYLIAHEIGHLLLPGVDHAASGIMCPQMREGDWNLARVGALTFNPQQAVLLRAKVAARHQPQLIPARATLDGRR